MGERKCDCILPYEKFLTHGPESLTDAELLAIIIRTGTKEKNALQIGEEILELHSGHDGQGSILGLCNLTIKELLQVDGIGEVKAVKLKCIAELSRRIWMTHNRDRLRFSSPASVAAYYMENLRHASKEHAILLSLNTKCELLQETVLSIGTVNMSLVSPREVFVQAIRDNASCVMLLHNHPSGDPTPSEADFRLTKELVQAGELLHLPLLDHIIIGDQQYTSFKESNCI